MRAAPSELQSRLLPYQLDRVNLGPTYRRSRTYVRSNKMKNTADTHITITRPYHRLFTVCQKWHFLQSSTKTLRPGHVIRTQIDQTNYEHDGNFTNSKGILAGLLQCRYQLVCALHSSLCLGRILVVRQDHENRLFWMDVAPHVSPSRRNRHCFTKFVLRRRFYHQRKGGNFMVDRVLYC